ncbi:MAG TPA: helix-turn-helix domain-containing protein [Streptosporangiaceae bacterium]
MKRLSRAEQNERNRALVLEAARRVFLARGYHAATLDEIADQAGFSRGVVQSRFGNKADLFLALLEERITERAAQNARLAEGLAGAEGMRVLREHAARRNRAERDWGLLLIEFRVHAARDAELSRRYAALHGRTRQGLAGVITGLYRRAGQPPPFPPEEIAQMILTVEAGVRLEQAADPQGLESPAAFERLRGFIESPLPTGDGARKAGSPR